MSVGRDEFEAWLVREQIAPSVTEMDRLWHAWRGGVMAMWQQPQAAIAGVKEQLRDNVVRAAELLVQTKGRYNTERAYETLLQAVRDYKAGA